MYTSQPDDSTFTALTPCIAVPGTALDGVTITTGALLNFLGNVKCPEVGSFGLGVMAIFPVCIMYPPKAEFCTQKGIKEWKLEQDRERYYFIRLNKEGVSMYIGPQELIMAGSVITAVMGIFAVVFAVYRWYLKQNKQDEEIEKIKSEQCLLTYGILACLKGMKEQGCNGPVTEAIVKIEKHVNKQAHDQEG